MPLDAIADVLSAQPGRRMAIEDLNTVFGTSAPGASAKLAQAALQVAHLVPVPGERPVLVLDEKWRRGARRPAPAAREAGATSPRTPDLKRKSSQIYKSNSDKFDLKDRSPRASMTPVMSPRRSSTSPFKEPVSPRQQTQIVATKLPPQTATLV